MMWSTLLIMMILLLFITVLLQLYDERCYKMEHEMAHKSQMIEVPVDIDGVLMEKVF